MYFRKSEAFIYSPIKDAKVLLVADGKWLFLWGLNPAGMLVLQTTSNSFCAKFVETHNAFALTDKEMPGL